MSGKIAKAIIEEHRVACLTTNSLRTILELFSSPEEKYSYNISRLNATASNIENVKPTIYDKTYGIEAFRGRKLDTFNIDFRLRFDKDGVPVNPIDSNGRKLIEEALDGLNLEDASVDTVSVLIKDPEIGKLSGTNEELFHLTLVSDPVDGDADKPTHFMGKQYYPFTARANIGICHACEKLIVGVPLILFLDQGRKGQLDFCHECAKERGIYKRLLDSKMRRGGAKNG